MHAFDYLVTLFSFVFALAIAHILATIGDLVVASRRLTFSWLTIGWMLAVLVDVIAWWLGIWDLRKQGSWPTITIFFFFGAAAGLYVLSRVVCPRISDDGPVDLRDFHRREGPKYMLGYGAFSVFTVGANTYFGLMTGGDEQRRIVAHAERGDHSHGGGGVRRRVASRQARSSPYPPDGGRHVDMVFLEPAGRPSWLDLGAPSWFRSPLPPEPARHASQCPLSGNAPTSASDPTRIFAHLRVKGRS